MSMFLCYEEDMERVNKTICVTLVILSALAPLSLAVAATPFYYAGWIPFWSKQGGAQNASLNLEKLREVSPFSYEVKNDGTLVDKLKINEGLWPGWLHAVRDAGIKIIPTIAWFNGADIHKLLSNKNKRLAHEDAIAKLVKDNKFDGIDIDYEGKLAETNPYFSLFIQGLAIRLHPMKKILSCTVEARMPVSSRYYQTGTSADYEYANDYKVLNKYCDEVRIMAYDQGVIDIKLDAQKGNGKLYAPVADGDWSEKVIKETIKTINPKKVMLGVPTYGYEYEVVWSNGVTTYRRLRSLNFFQAINVAVAAGVPILRNSAGEAGFWYTSSTLIEVSPALRWDVSSTEPAEIAFSSAARGITRFVSLSDSRAAAEKIALAKKYGLRGVVFFKFDGEFDPLLWRVMN